MILRQKICLAAILIANAVWSERVEDLPETAYTYPNAQPGFPSFTTAIHADARGFRNQTALDHADVVTLGDSFVDGSHVSDEHPWPVKFAGLTGLSVYNLGMSGYSPIWHLTALKEYGLSLKPRFVICMIYEGNDFRSAKSVNEDAGYGLGKLLQVYFKQSPVLNALDNRAVKAFGGVGSGRKIEGMDTLSWLPLRVPADPASKYCAFARIGSKKIPEAGAFVSNLLPYLGVREAVVKRCCEQRDIRFVSATGALRQAAAEGRQVYFTYDQHWTPLGHDVVAQAVADFWTRNQLGRNRSAAASQPL